MMKLRLNTADENTALLHETLRNRDNKVIIDFAV